MVNTVNSQRLAKNTIALYTRTGIVMLISLYVTRVLLDALGTEDYGIYNIVGSIVVTFSFFNFTLQSAIQRFMTVSVGKNDNAELQKVFSISFIILAALVFIVIIICETIGVWFLENKLRISPDRISAAKIVFQLSILTFSLGVLRIPLEALVIAWEKMSFFAYVSIFDQFIRLVGVLLLIRLNADKLILYSVLMALIAIVGFCLYLIYCRKKLVGVNFVLIWDKNISKEMFSFSGWTFLSSSTSMGTQQAFTFLLNLFYGVVANAAMGIANQVSHAVNSFVAGFQTAFKPQLVKSCVQEEWSTVYQLVNTTSKISFLLMFIPGFLMIMSAPYILNVWLLNVPQYAVAFCRLLLVQMIIDATTGPYYATIMANGNIKWYQISVSCAFVLDIIGICLLFMLGVGAEYVLYSRIVTRGGLCMIIGLFFMKKLIGFSVKDYIRKTIIPILIFILFIVVFCLLGSLFLRDLPLLVYSISIVLFMGLPLAYFFVLSTQERLVVKDLFKKKFNKK